MYAPESDVARLAYFALYALQHRGQESAGIATCDERPHHDPARPRPRLAGVRRAEAARPAGQMAVGHVRYSTTGSSAWENAQPVYRSDRRQVALAHNGNLINAVELHSELTDARRPVPLAPPTRRSSPRCSPPTRRTRIEDALADVMPRLEGAFSTVVMTKDSRGRLPRRRRPAAAVARQARRPLLRGLGELRLRHHRRRAAARGPAGRDGLARRGAASRRARSSSRERKAFCVFEHIYFARPDSILEGNRTQVSRRKMGEILWREAPVEADVVIAVPDSGNPAAAGYSKASGIPRDDGLIKNRYVARTFIQPGPGAAQARPADEVQPAARGGGGQAARGGRRLDRARQHHAPDREDAARRRRRRGAHAHLGAADPPPLPLRDRHVHHAGDGRPRAHRARRSPRSSAATRSPTCRSTASTRRSAPTRETHCDACFSGDYPLERTDDANGKFALEELAVVRSLSRPLEGRERVVGLVEAPGSRSPRRRGSATGARACGCPRCRCGGRAPRARTSTRARASLALLEALGLEVPMLLEEVAPGGRRTPRPASRPWSTSRRRRATKNSPGLNSISRVADREHRLDADLARRGLVERSQHILQLADERRACRLHPRPVSTARVHGTARSLTAEPALGWLSAMDLDRRAARDFRLPRLPPRPARGVRGRAGGPRRARGHAHRLGQVALLPAAGAAARRPHDRRLAARGADAGPGRGAARARPRRHGRARQRAAGRRRQRGRPASARWRASCGCSTWRPSASRSPGFLERMRAGARRAVRGRRGALRLAVGARLPARLLPPGRRRAARSAPASIVASTATATPRVAADVASRLGLRDPLRVATGFDRPNISFAVARPAPHEKRALIAEALRGPDALPAIVYAGTRAGAEEIAVGADARRSARRRSPTTPGWSASAAPTSSAASSPDEVARDRGHQRLRHGRRQAERAHGRPRQRAGLARGLLPGGRPRRPRRAARAGAAARREPRQGAARPLHQARRARRGPARLARRPAARPPRTATAATRSRPPELARALGGDGDRLRALLGHLARAGVVSPSPAAPDRVAGQARSGASTAAPRRSAAPRSRRARARAGASTARSGPTSRRTACRRRPILQPLRRPVGPRPRRRCRCCDVCDPELVPDAARRRTPRSFARPRRRDRLGGRGARPAVGRTTCAEILHGARTKKIERNSYDGLPAYGASVAHAPCGHPRAGGRADREGRLETTGGAVPGAAGSPRTPRA